MEGKRQKQQQASLQKEQRNNIAYASSEWYKVIGKDMVCILGFMFQHLIYVYSVLALLGYAVCFAALYQNYL